MRKQFSIGKQSKEFLIATTLTTRNEQNINTQSYRFYAFISYSRKNEKTAKWLQKKLESYRLPSVLQKQNSSLPKKLKVFRDQTDIGVGGTVEHALSRELQDSKKLIVLCSPDSAKSDYVEYEVASFLKLGRSTDDILPFVVEGKIDSKSEQNCYTPLLTSLNLNAADATAEGLRNAFIRLLASLLGIKYDDLKQRERVRIIRRNALIGGIFSLTFACASLFLWYVIPHTYFYADYACFWEIPKGIEDFRLSKKEVEFLPAHYEITTRCFRPIKLVYANAKGIPIAQSLLAETQNRPSVALYAYKNPYFPTKNKKDWQLSTATCMYYDSDDTSDIQKSCSIRINYTQENENAILTDFCYNTENTISKNLFNDVLSDKCLFFSDVVESEKPEDSRFKTPEQEFFENGGAIYRYRIDCDQNGLARKITFYNKNNHAVSDKNGIAGFENYYDEKNRLVLQTYIYMEETPLSVHQKRISYDAYTVSELAFFTQENLPVLNHVRAYSSYKTHLEKLDDTYSFVAEFFDEQGEPSVAGVLNCSSVKHEYDKNGFITRREMIEPPEDIPPNMRQYFPKTGSTITHVFVTNSNGFPLEIHKYNDDTLEEKIHFEYDKNLCLAQKKYFSGDGKAVRKIAYSYQDKQYKEIVRTTEKETIRNEYDAYGRLLSQSKTLGANTTEITKIVYYGGNKIISHYQNDTYCNKEGFATAQFSYTNDGMLYFVQFFNSEGKKAKSPELNFSEYVALYTPNGLLVHESFKDAYGELTISKKKYAYYEAKQNLADTVLLEGAYYLPDGELAKRKSIVRFDSELLSNGKIKISYYDGNDALVYEKIHSPEEED